MVKKIFKKIKKRPVVKEASNKQQCLVVPWNVDKLKGLGWKVVKKGYNDIEGRELGVKTHVSDLVLMEK